MPAVHLVGDAGVNQGAHTRAADCSIVGLRTIMHAPAIRHGDMMHARRRRFNMDDSSRESGSLAKAVPHPPADACPQSAFGQASQHEFGVGPQGGPRR